MSEQSTLFYLTGFCTEKVAIKKDDAAWLQMEALVVQNPDGSVEMGFISAKSHSEQEWTDWCTRHMDEHVSVQWSALVPMGHESEACIERLIDKYAADYRIIEQNNALFWEAYRIVSNGKMHFEDTRNWCMSKEMLDEMHKGCIALRKELDKLWQRRFDIAFELDAARDVLALVEKIRPYMIKADADDYMSEQYSIGGLPFNFALFFDGHDVRVLETKELELLVQLDEKSRTVRRMECVYQRQELLIKQRSYKKRKYAHKARAPA